MTLISFVYYFNWSRPVTSTGTCTSEVFLKAESATRVQSVSILRTILPNLSPFHILIIASGALSMPTMTSSLVLIFPLASQVTMSGPNVGKYF